LDVRRWMQVLKEKIVPIEDVKETSHRLSISLAIRDLLLDEVSGDVLEESPQVEALAARIRGEMRIFPMRKHEAFTHVAGVDAGSQILPLSSRRYGIMSALAYSLPGGVRFFIAPESMSIPYTSMGERFRGTMNVRREAKLYETAALFLESYPETELLLVDGPLAFSNLWMLSGCRKDRERFVEAVNRLLRGCRDAGVAVAGIVKRPSARYLVCHLGLQDETELPDSFLLLQALRAGERTDIFSPRSALREAGLAAPFMDAFEAPIYSFYARMSREWSIPPIRVDLPAYSLAQLDDVADYCYSSSYYDGIPLPIVRADEEVRISRRFVADIYSEIVGRVERARVEVSHIAPYWGEARWMGA